MTGALQQSGPGKPAKALRGSALRLAWALLASLLLHLMLIGDLANLQWWRPFTRADTPGPLDVQLLPAAASDKQRMHASGAPAIPEPPPRSNAEPDPDAGVLSAAPMPEAHIAEPPETPQEQNLTADLPAVPAQPAVKPGEDKIARRLPPNGKLIYQFYWGKSRWLAGQAVHQWVIGNGYYSLTSTVSTAGLFQWLHPLKLVETSKGIISGETLRPLQFSTQLNEYPLAVAIFDWEKEYYRWFRGKTAFTQVLPKNSYDKISYLYQLYLAPRQEDYYSAEITMGRRLEHYDILNLGREEIEIEGNIYPSIHLRRATATPDMENVDIWLATDMDNLPLKMTYSNQAGDHFEQLIAGDSLPRH